MLHGYRRHVELEPAELDRLEPAVAARPMIFDTWSFVAGRVRLTDVAANRTKVQTKAHQIAAPARAALSTR